MAESVSPPATLDILTRALELFRRDYGVQATPEDFPDLWLLYLIKAEEELET